MVIFHGYVSHNQMVILGDMIINFPLIIEVFMFMNTHFVLGPIIQFGSNVK